MWPGTYLIVSHGETSFAEIPLNEVLMRMRDSIKTQRQTGPGVEFCVSDIRQSQEWRCGNRAECGLKPLLTSAPEARDGMRASA